MGISITSNIGERGGKLSDEFLGKLRADSADDLKRIYSQKKAERDSFLSTIPKGLSKNELESKQAEIDIKLKELFPSKSPKPIKEVGRHGNIVSDHKDRLAFIFIGDTKSAEENTFLDINAPKISMVVGGGLETSFNPKTGEQTKIDPREDYIIGVSAQLHLISLSDIDVSGILQISTLKNRSVVKAEADILDLSASEVVIIRSLGRPYGSSGARILTPGGVHIVSGQNTKDKKLKEPEPMVLGKGLSDTIFEIVNKISEINSTIISMNEDMLSLKVALLAHFHLSAGGVPGTPTSPSMDLALSVVPTISSKTMLNITNGYSNLVNLEILKTNKLTPLSAGSFLSKHNRVN